MVRGKLRLITILCFPPECKPTVICVAFYREYGTFAPWQRSASASAPAYLGENVRYDGGHALDRFLKDTLGTYVHYVPVCPEVECGFGIPRETIRLTGDPEHPRLVTTCTGVDHTERMEAWAGMRVAELEHDDLCGFIFKSNSPSCGMERVKVYDEKGMARKIGVGIFARIFMERFPLIPVEEDGRLHDPILRENFIDRIFAYKRCRESMDRKRAWLRNHG